MLTPSSSSPSSPATCRSLYVVFISDILREVWAVLRLQEQNDLDEFSSEDGPPVLANSQWLLPIVALQVALYRSAGDLRWQLGSEVLQLAASDATFARYRASSGVDESYSGSNGDAPDAFDLSELIGFPGCCTFIFLPI